MKLKKQKASKEVIITGISALALIEMVALFKGINGVLLSLIIAVIAAAIGISLPIKIKE